ncbi:MAG: METTL5 family protein [Methanomassiliicoccaceae archaeon]|nr:METTL5 family protein [Methanomassiliicoccaceae archaeon]
MKKKDLEIKLQGVKDFVDPDPSLEQYMTPAVIASDMLFIAYSEGDIADAYVSDLGCGTGMLAIGAKLLGAKHVHGYDVSKDAIETAEANAHMFDVDIEFEACDINDVDHFTNTVVMNPPFGCQKKRADRKFLEKAMDIGETIYSMHMANTEPFLKEYITAYDREICFRKTYRFNIPHTFSFHSKAEHSVDIVMLLIR